MSEKAKIWYFKIRKINQNGITHDSNVIFLKRSLLNLPDYASLFGDDDVAYSAFKGGRRCSSPVINVIGNSWYSQHG